MQPIIDSIIDIWQEKGVTKILPSEGKSMYPLIKQGDNISIKFTKPENVRVGDIVAFRRGNITIVHRLIKKEGNNYIEKGDFQMKGGLIDSGIIFGKVEIQNYFFGCAISTFGYIIHKLGRIAKPLLIIPYTINAGTRIYIKLRKA